MKDDFKIVQSAKAVVVDSNTIIEDADNHDVGEQMLVKSVCDLPVVVRLSDGKEWALNKYQFFRAVWTPSGWLS